MPLPPVGVALAATTLVLETTGFVLLRLTGHEVAALSMDAPYSLPRLFVEALFAAALAAEAGAGVLPGRRAWWTAVGVVAGGIAAVKIGSTVHADVMAALTRLLGWSGAVVVSAGPALLVVAALWFLSRDDRRDRRRMLGCPAGYGVASVGLSAVSSLVGSGWDAAATYLEESGEALAGVAFLVAVLVGVAPRLVLPADWPLRRAVDAQTLDVPDAVSGARRAAPGA